jgi:glycosyltransferase involved in cell wall biosynthesis
VGSDRPAVFCFYRDTPERRRALSAPAGSGERYPLYGLDQLAANGFAVSHSLELGRTSAAVRALGAMIAHAVFSAPERGSDFGRVLRSLRRANDADALLALGDRVGIPLLLLRSLKRLRLPLVYASLGFPEYLEEMRAEPIRRFFIRALASSEAVITFSRAEADAIAGLLDGNGAAPPAQFLPFGVDEGYFSPRSAVPATDVLSVGRNRHRDFSLLVRFARKRPDLRFKIVASAEHAGRLRDAPRNLEVATEVPLSAVRDALASTRMVVLPIRDNIYSGATTTLLQAMAMAKPVIVTRTAANADGYRLVDGINCRLIAPGDDAGLAAAVDWIERSNGAAQSLGAAARETVERHLTWSRYTEALADAIGAASAQARS